MAEELTRIVLVHGAAHGAWCWEMLVPRLAAMGFEVDAPDLPGLGDDPTPAKEVTLRSYVERVVEVIRAKSGRALLVGHSMGGAPITGAAEAAPERIGRLVYLAAVLPRNGESMADVAETVARGSEPSVSDALIPCDVEGAHGLDIPKAIAGFYNTCPPDVAARAAARLRPQAVAPLSEPIRTSTARWGTVQKTYIICRQDRALPPRVQRIMAGYAPDASVLEMDTDHSPFYSAPEQLAAILAAQARG